MYDIEQINNILLAKNFAQELFSDVIGDATFPTDGDLLVTCPFHQDDTPSFSISNVKPVYNCFGCGEKGDWIAYVMKRNGWDFVKSLEYLAQVAGVSKSETKIKPKRTDFEKKAKKEAEPRDIDYKANTIYMANCNFALLENKSAMDFINQLRGINENTIKQTGLGIDTERRVWTFPAFSVEDKCSMGFPNIVGFEQRRHDFTPFVFSGKEHKCIKTKGTPSELCCVNPRMDAKSVIILEGFLDAYLYYQYLADMGLEQSVWILTPSCGLSKLMQQILSFDFSSFDNITIMLDNDTEGLKMTKALDEVRPQYNYNILPEGIKDFNEFYLKEVLKRK